MGAVDSVPSLRFSFEQKPSGESVFSARHVPGGYRRVATTGSRPLTTGSTSGSRRSTKRAIGRRHARWLPALGRHARRRSWDRLAERMTSARYCVAKDLRVRVFVSYVHPCCRRGRHPVRPAGLTRTVAALRPPLRVQLCHGRHLPQQPQAVRYRRRAAKSAAAVAPTHLYETNGSHSQLQTISRPRGKLSLIHI